MGVLPWLQIMRLLLTGRDAVMQAKDKVCPSDLISGCQLLHTGVGADWCRRSLWRWYLSV